MRFPFSTAKILFFTCITPVTPNSCPCPQCLSIPMAILWCRIHTSEAQIWECPFLTQTSSLSLMFTEVVLGKYMMLSTQVISNSAATHFLYVDSMPTEIQVFPCHWRQCSFFLPQCFFSPKMSFCWLFCLSLPMYQSLNQMSTPQWHKSKRSSKNGNESGG